MEHTKLAHEFDLQEKAVLHVTAQLKEIKDLEIEKQYEEMVRRYTDGYRKIFWRARIAPNLNNLLQDA